MSIPYIFPLFYFLYFPTSLSLNPFTLFIESCQAISLLQLYTLLISVSSHLSSPFISFSMLLFLLLSIFLKSFSNCPIFFSNLLNLFSHSFIFISCMLLFLISSLHILLSSFFNLFIYILSLTFPLIFPVFSYFISVPHKSHFLTYVKLAPHFLSFLFFLIVLHCATFVPIYIENRSTITWTIFQKNFCEPCTFQILKFE